MDYNEKAASNIEIISYYSGVIIFGTALLMLIPIFFTIVCLEFAPLIDFIISFCITMLVGILLMIFGRRTQIQNATTLWKHGYIIAAFTWIVLMMLCAIPYRLSGHLQSFLDSCFDVMSGFTTTGLLLTQDLDHLSVGLNMWRHLLTFIGGQGMIVLALSFISNQVSGAYRLYVGEAKDIELVPNVVGTAKIIWKISMVYLAIGTFMLWVTGIIIGLNPITALFHGFYMFASAWSTGGFSPMTQNMMYYHSFAYEIICLIILVLGSFNFGLHYAVWQGNRKEFVKNIETRSFFITSLLSCILILLWLAKSNVYPDAVSDFRRVVFNVLSAHTTTGFTNIYARQFALEWGDIGVLIMAIAMLIGGSACSTAGGFKGLRVAIVFKSIIADIKKLLSSERSIKVYKYHHIKDSVLEDGGVKSSAIIILCYIVLFAVGTIMGIFCGYPLGSSAFEAASVTGNVGLSIGVTSVSMPNILKIYYIIAMYMGRLEFISVFALIGFIIKGVKKLCRKY
ncbi:trk system potassium uptake protein TrkH [Hydrogenoanaerobacterium saccharovorans]|uniref:Trk system potassium uptake protein TrkH n=1 Tax=Hydrogenoanaerobacterium saccharovorans TaxID=474960 RepID=A0A1H8BLG5_9FIRM|nr:potassium transporter TrkG [Hydrogenoanaerobacterium saccharovorans]RPF47347.1 trk system potassium uptake protein TrkH [Hydrogenoanaerobacterium saccharovorans]SEM83636.1 trk system potassium uptake protein TrkH [Hydrogenoanaerobacterium saccharovorans]